MGLLRFRIDQQAQLLRGLAQGPVRLARHARLVPLAATAVAVTTLDRSRVYLRTRGRGLPVTASTGFVRRFPSSPASQTALLTAFAANSSQTRGGPPLAGRPLLDSLAAAPASVAAQAPLLERSVPRASAPRSRAAQRSNFNQWQNFTRGDRRAVLRAYALRAQYQRDVRTRGHAALTSARF